jgi:hypothetical protein
MCKSRYVYRPHILIFLFFFFVLPLLAFSQQSQVSENQEPAEEQSIISVSGSFYSQFDALWKWHGYYPAPRQFWYPDSSLLTADVAADFAIQARPSDSFLALARVKAFYPFNSEHELPSDISFLTNNINIQELYAQFDYQDIVYFKTGKYFIDWSPGYFFSASDVINRDRIDPLDPEADRNGPLSMKVRVPLSYFNVSLYLLMDRISLPQQIGVAPQVTFAYEPVTADVGFIYSQAKGSNITLSAELDISFFNLFADSIISYGVQKKFLERTEDSPTWPEDLEVVTRDEQWFFSISPGVRFSYPDWQLEAVIQYLYNGKGYTDPSIVRGDDVSILLAQERITEEDLDFPGKHYAAGEIEWGIFDTGLSLSVFGIMNMSSWTGKLIPELLWSPFSYVDLGISFPMDFGEEGREFSPYGYGLSFGCHLCLGGEF